MCESSLHLLPFDSLFPWSLMASPPVTFLAHHSIPHPSYVLCIAYFALPFFPAYFFLVLLSAPPPFYSSSSPPLSNTDYPSQPAPRAAPTPSVPPSPCPCSTPPPTRAWLRKWGPGAWLLCRAGRSELWREGRLRRRCDGMKFHTNLTKCALFDAGVDLNNRRHSRGKSGHLKRAAEVALRAGEALVPRLTALITASDRAHQEQESWGSWKHMGTV
ncbi:hypothetical protein DFH08DRAFT_318761 [Mycena albidolilacea]|uniref:Uncharacterized protein n=1 Tax=Mycena albidolilacea TaxID=1033008 RepID=A0AAD7EIK6_9AGAR|nr:hypothetical protein DFH08DRAFT_318761 [Mycena albidolilacea]